MTTDLTIACCVEYGTLEPSTVRLAESIRLFGGRFADVPIVAVTPRMGPPLNELTLARFRELNVTYVRSHPRNRYAWLPYLNKYFCLKSAEERAGDGNVAWVDSDMIVMREPDELELADDEDIASCPRDKNIGTTGPADEFDGYWQRVCRDNDLSLEQLPWVTTTADAARIRLYWNAGLFVYRPRSGLADTWFRTIHRTLDRTGREYLGKVFWVDQVALGLAAHKLALRYRNMSGAMNYGIASHFREHLTPEGMKSAKVLHYHDSMSPTLWPWFLDQLETTRPDVFAWLARQGPVRHDSRGAADLVKQAFRIERSARRRGWSLRHALTR
jgi:hypothetical protein